MYALNVLNLYSENCGESIFSLGYSIKNGRGRVFNFSKKWDFPLENNYLSLGNSHFFEDENSPPLTVY